MLDVLYEPHRLSTISFQTWFGNNTEEDHLGEDNGEKNGTDTTMEVNREKSTYRLATLSLTRDPKSISSGSSLPCAASMVISGLRGCFSPPLYASELSLAYSNFFVRCTLRTS